LQIEPFAQFGAEGEGWGIWTRKSKSHLAAAHHSGTASAFTLSLNVHIPLFVSLYGQSYLENPCHRVESSSQNSSESLPIVIQLSAAHAEAIACHAAQMYPHECCGALIGVLDDNCKTVTEARPLSNVHEDDHAHRYLVSPKEMRQLIREERETGIVLLGFYHSHPDGIARPSHYDSDWAFPFYTYIIVAVANGTPEEMTAWILDERDGLLKEEGIIS
jgi:proteasome lid subunit RPN8/RPN11